VPATAVLGFNDAITGTGARTVTAELVAART
jgi:hypothetical protein